MDPGGLLQDAVLHNANRGAAGIREAILIGAILGRAALRRDKRQASRGERDAVRGSLDRGEQAVQVAGVREAGGVPRSVSEVGDDLLIRAGQCVRGGACQGGERVVGRRDGKLREPSVPAAPAGDRRRCR